MSIAIARKIRDAHLPLAIPIGTKLLWSPNTVTVITWEEYIQSNPFSSLTTMLRNYPLLYATHIPYRYESGSTGFNNIEAVQILDIEEP